VKKLATFGALLAATLIIASPAGAAGHNTLGPLTVQTIPSTPGLVFELAGHTFRTDRRGEFVLPGGLRSLITVQSNFSRYLVTKKLRLIKFKARGGGEFRIERWYGVRPLTQQPAAAIDRWRPVAFTFHDRTGRVIDPKTIDSVVLKRIDGEVLTLTGKQLAGKILLQTTRVTPLNGELLSKQLLYRLQAVSIGGNNVVNRGQQWFYPANKNDVPIELLYYLARIKVRDTLFGFPIGSAVKLQSPDGSVVTYRLHKKGEVMLPPQPRGQYKITVDAPGISPNAPISITRDHVTTLTVFSYLDMGAVALVAILVFGGLLLARRPKLRRQLSPVTLAQRLARQST
jgi:hypothetical protein